MAPSFELTASDGRKISSEGLRGQKNLVLYFYPADFTPVCTKETCGFRDAYQELSGQDTEVVGVSVDSTESHARFAEKYNVPFPLVSDEDQELARKFGVNQGLLGKLHGLMGNTRRVTFVIDKTGTIAAIFAAELSASAHLDGAREAVARLSGR